MYFLIYCVAVIAYAMAPPTLTSGPFDETAETKWFSQRLDHSDPSNSVTWQQRYHIYNEYFGGKGAVILYICGEWTCNGIGGGSFTFQLAKQFNAIVLVLEHRFYGRSMPFGSESFKSDNLKYLSVHQALDDLAYFILKIKGQHGITEQMPWIAVGGSYPGALSAWMRAKYPHLTVGNLASSAVVNTILDYPQFDEQIRISTLKSGLACPTDLQLMNSYVDQQLNDASKKKTFKTSFRGEQFTDNEFRFFFVDTIVQLVQSGTRTNLCSDLAARETVAQKVDYVRTLALNQGDSYQQYGSYYLRNDTVDYNKNHRQWYYQCCTEVAYFQTAPNNRNSLRSQELNLNFYKQWCNDAYKVDKDVWPRTDVTEAYFGGLGINVDHLIMNNGEEDPWKTASIIQSTSKNSKILIQEIKCDNCSHCVDLHAPSDSDPQTLKVARQNTVTYLQQWINEHWAKK